MATHEQIELDPKAALRLEHAGQWIAWTSNFGEFVTAGPDREQVKAAAKAAGIERPLLEWISPSLARRGGGGE